MPTNRASIVQILSVFINMALFGRLCGLIIIIIIIHSFLYRHKVVTSEAVLIKKRLSFVILLLWLAGFCQGVTKKDQVQLTIIYKPIQFYRTDSNWTPFANYSARINIEIR